MRKAKATFNCEEHHQTSGNVSRKRFVWTEGRNDKIENDTVCT